MNETERQTLIDHLRSSPERLRRATAGLTPAQWHFREGEGRWTIAEIMEHLAVVEEGLLGRVRKKLTEPPEPEKRSLTEGRDRVVPEIAVNRETRVVAGEAISPTGRWSADQVFDVFAAARERTIVFVRENAVDLRDHIFPHRRLGEMDCYQWLLFIGSHAERHARQIDEIKTHSGYPAN